MDREIFEERLKSLRGNQSRNSVAKEIGMNPQTLERYEKGERLPDIEAVSLIAKYYGVSIDWLCGNDKTDVSEAEKIAMISEYTGLTKENIEDLHEIFIHEQKDEVLNAFMSNPYMIETLNKVMQTDAFSDIIFTLGIMTHSKFSVASLTYLDLEELCEKRNIPIDYLVNSWISAVVSTTRTADKLADYMLTAKISDCRYNNIKNMEKLNNMFDKTDFDDMSTNEIIEMFDKARVKTDNKIDPFRLMPLSDLRKIYNSANEEVEE